MKPQRTSLSIASMTVLGCVCVSGCSPAAPATPQQVNTLIGPLSLSGVVVGNQDRQPIPGVRLELFGSGSARTTTDAQGRFSFPTVSDGLLIATLTASGYLDRVTKMSLSRSRTDVVLDMIATAAPFSLEYYRQLARGLADPGALLTIKPWETAPSFYVTTNTIDTHEAVSPAIIDDLKRLFEASVPDLTGGRLRMASFETGSEPRAGKSGWVAVTFWHELTPGINGSSTIGPSGPNGVMRLRYDPAIDQQGLYNPQRCRSFTVNTADHEIVHTMGFYHPLPNASEFHSANSCSGSGRPDRLRYHAGIAYSRPYGNGDPDKDPESYTLLLRAPAAPAEIVYCLAEGG
jgi:hypothetical protein